MKLFKELGLNSQMLKAIKKLGISEPTQIQRETIPAIIAKKDVIGESATGSGKTLAFGSGVIEHVKPGEGLQAVILTPTRELAEQVKESLVKYSYETPLHVISVYGGVSIGPQINSLRRCDVVVATPGRFLDHLQRQTINVSKVKLLILDEADRMLDMGFIDDVEKIIRQCPKERQTLFFFATSSPSLRNLGKRHMKDPIYVGAIKQVDPKKLKQVYYNIPKTEKLSVVVHLLEHEKSGLVMVFCNTRRTTDFVTKNLKANGISAIAIHGGLTQNKRTNTLKLFNNAKVGVLVCTDVAARGLHIENVSHIYNYEIPRDAKEYVHRIGRTARAGGEGKVINLLSEMDYDNFSKILNEYENFDIPKVQKPLTQKIVIIKPESNRRTGGRNQFSRNENPRRSNRRKVNRFR